MTAGVYNITAEQGSLFARTIRYEDTDGNPIVLTGYTAAMQVRKQSYLTPVLDLSTALDGGITIDGATGTITLSVPATVMAGTQPGIYQYDLELTPPSGAGDTFRLIQGSFNVTREITREGSS